MDRLDKSSTNVDFGVGTVQMVNDGYRENLLSREENEDRREVPSLKTMRFFEMLDVAKQPLYKWCRNGHWDFLADLFCQDFPMKTEGFLSRF